MQSQGPGPLLPFISLSDVWRCLSVGAVIDSNATKCPEELEDCFSECGASNSLNTSKSDPVVNSFFSES